MTGKIINWIVAFLLCVGAVFLAGKILSMSSNDLVALATQVIQYASIPVAILLKLIQLVTNELKNISEIREIALANRGNDDSLKSQISFVRDDFRELGRELGESIRSLDRRMIRLEAKNELSTKLERHERLIHELTDRLNKS